MPKIKYVCKECNSEVVISFHVGKKPEDPICEKCKATMIRDFGKISLGDVESDDMSNIRMTMKNSQSFTGKDKTVY